jgi:hypothetical protein
VLELYLFTVFSFIKNLVLGDFSIKKHELPPVCDCMFVDFSQLGIIYDSQAANRSEVGEGGSHRGSFLLPIGPLGAVCI